MVYNEEQNECLYFVISDKVAFVLYVVTLQSHNHHSRLANPRNWSLCSGKAIDSD